MDINGIIHSCNSYNTYMNSREYLSEGDKVKYSTAPNFAGIRRNGGFQMFEEKWAGIIETLELEYSIRCRTY